MREVRQVPPSNQPRQRDRRRHGIRANVRLDYGFDASSAASIKNAP